MPQRSTENDPHRHTILQKIHEMFFGQDEDSTPRMERFRAVEEASRNVVQHETERTQETRRKVRELTGRDVEIIPQSEADNRAKSIISGKNTGLQVGSKDAESIVKSIRRHNGK